MIKRLLFSAMAAAAVAFSASADTYNLMSVMGTGGWGDCSYDAETKTITYDAAWCGKGIWWGSPGFDASSYDELVFECEASTVGFNLTVQYVGTETQSSVFFDAGTTKDTLALIYELKITVQQIYIQANAAGSIVVKTSTSRTKYMLTPQSL